VVDTFVQAVSAALVSPAAPKSTATRVVSTAALAVPAAPGAPRCSFTCHDVGRVGNATSVIIHTGTLLTAQSPKSAMIASYYVRLVLGRWTSRSVSYTHLRAHETK